MILSASSYYHVLKTHHDAIYNEKINFLKTIFPKWTSSAIHQMLYYIKSLKAHRGEYIYKQFDQSKFIYFVKNGEIELLKKII